MLALALTICLLPQVAALPSIEEVRKGMYLDMRKLSSYSDEWSVEPKDDQETHFLYKRWIDLKRNKMSITVNDTLLLESGFDGKNTWAIAHPPKLFADEPAINEEKMPESFGPPADAADGTFKFTFEGAYDFTIFVKPDLKVLSLETVQLGDRQVRKLSCATVRETGKMEVEMWFDLDRWRLVKAHAKGGRNGEPATEATLTMLKSSFDEKYDSGSFTLEQAKVAGYTKKAFADLLGGGA